MQNSSRIYGIRAVIEAINSKSSIDKIFIQKGLGGNLYKELEALIRENGISFSYVPVEKLNRLSKSNHQGVVANISPIEFHNFETLVEEVIQKKKLLCFSF